MMLLSIIIPVFNEEGLVCDLLRKVVDLRFDDNLDKEIIIVDDGSSDATASVISHFIETLPASSNCRFLKHDQNRGKGAAVRTGMDAAKGDILIIQDADLEYDPQDIKDVVRPILDGRAHVVYGSRILMEKSLGRAGVCGLITGKHPHSYVLAYLGGVTITKLVNLLTGARLTDEPTCYKCFHRDALEGIAIEQDDFAWEPEITMKLLQGGTPIAEVPVSYHPRKNPEGKKINWKDGVKALWTIWSYR
jgi:glycosyltransferase involved in cell wall biosynthesis